MAVFSGPEIVNDGLVFHYDMGNTEKSWKGKPTTNIRAGNTLITHGGNTPIIDNSYSNWIDGEGGWSSIEASSVNTNHRLAQFSYNSLAINTDYTFSLELFNPGLPLGILIDGTSGQPITNIPYGRSTYSYTMNRSTAGTQAIFFTSYNYQTSTTYSPPRKIYFKNYQVEQNSFATPFVNGTRSNTEAVRDLTGNNTITANSLTYNSDGSFRFYGSNYIDTSISQFNLYNLDIWLYNDYVIPGNDTAIGGVVTSYQSIINFNRQTTQGINLGGWTGGATNESVHIWSNASTNSGYNGMTYIRDQIPIGWHNFQFNWNGSTYDIWIDGVKKTTYSHSSLGHAKLHPVSAIRVGGSVTESYHFVGKVPVVKMYSSLKTDQEIQQNFEAVRTRFGI